MLFLADRDVIEALIAASRRGVQTTVILDQNKISFGNPKAGFPNQVVANELLRRAPEMQVRWGNTRDEEFHNKFILLQTARSCILNAGSANLTRRSLVGTNPEANVRVEVPLETSLAQESIRYCEWLASEPRTLAADKRRRAPLRYLWYRIEEATGIATF